MTKKISAEICKKCGIEPLKLTGCSFINIQRFGLEEGTDVCEAAEREDENFKCADCQYSKVAELLFPDFGCAENFLKLFNLKIECKPFNTIAGIFDFYDEHILSITDNPTKTILKEVLRIVKCKKYDKNSLCDCVKTAIKNERWTI